jgi:hypothetical protein
MECVHLVVEDLGLAALRGGDEVAVKALEDVLADLGKLGLDLLAVLLDESNLGLVALGLLLLLNRGDDSPRSTAGTDDVLVSNGQKVALLNGELLVCAGNSLHVLDHLCRGGSAACLRISCTDELTLIALGLLGQLGQVNGVLVTHGESGGLQNSVVSKIALMRGARVVQQRAVANAQPAG